MNKKERVTAALNRKEADHIPSGFWMHFPKGFESGAAAEKAHLDFLKKTDCDICKVMNECYLSQGFFINEAEEWNKIKTFDKHALNIQKQIDLVKRIADNNTENAFILATVYDVSASLSHVLRNGNIQKRDRSIQTQHLRENPAGMKFAMDAITEVNQYMAEEFLRAGADGIYFAALNRKIYGYTHDEFEEYIKPHDLSVLNSLSSDPQYNVLHICKDDVDLSEFSSYPGGCVNWAVHGSNPGIDESKTFFQGRTVLGGLDNQAGALINGSKQDIEEQVKEIIKTVGKTGFILGADCTLPTDLSCERIRWAVEAAAEY